jgi:hypothetical protein
MTALNRNPINQNFFQPNKFILSFERAPNLQFFCQGVSVPGISMSEVPRNTPFVDLYVPGEKAIYDLMSVTFYVDEELLGWLEIHDWIRAMTFPKEFAEYTNLRNLNPNRSLNLPPQYSDASLTLLSSHNNPLYRFKFHELFPTSLSTFVVSTTESADNTVTADATFRFSYYDVEKLF